jgi:hypothetical protein
MDKLPSLEFFQGKVYLINLIYFFQQMVVSSPSHLVMREAQTLKETKRLVASLSHAPVIDVTRREGYLWLTI